MKYSLTKAASATGKGKSTIHRAIKSGKLSAEKQEDGSYLIDPAELHRVYPMKEVKPSGGTPQEPVTRDDQEPKGGPQNGEADLLRLKVEMLEAQLDRERETIEDLRRRLDRSEDRTLALSKAIEVKAREDEKATTGQREGLRGFLIRALGGKP